LAKTPTALIKQGGKYGDLKRRLGFLLLALVVYRVGAHVPVPGIDPDQLAQLFKQQSGGVLGLFNLFSGGALSRSPLLEGFRAGRVIVRDASQLAGHLLEFACDAEGARFLQHARNIMAAVNAAQHAPLTEDSAISGTVRIGVS
jgi:hypothetical protein